MGTRVRWLRWTFLAAIGLVIAAFAWDYGIQKNFDAVVPGKIYRSGQPSEGQLEEWIQEYGLRSILALRHEVLLYERELAERRRLKIYHVPLSAAKGLTEEQWKDIRHILTDENNLPILVHCHGGGDRSGIVTALYRVDVQGWTLEEAIREMNRHYHLPFRYPVLQDQLREHFQEMEPERASAQTAR